MVNGVVGTPTTVALSYTELPRPNVEPNGIEAPDEVNSAVVVFELFLFTVKGSQALTDEAA
jgi:hypothetical protein